MTRALTLLLHDERFSGWTLKDKLVRRHFSTEYLRLYRQNDFDPLLYTFHQDIRSRRTYELENAGTVKIFPVQFRFPFFLRFGNDHNPKEIVQEMLRDQPDVVHFHHYYLFSFPYIATYVRKRLKRPLIAQLHGIDNRSVDKWLYLPCMMALRQADKILYSYEPENIVYRELGVTDKAVKLPFPGVDMKIFSRGKRCEHYLPCKLLYVGRIPNPENAKGEKSPFLLIQILKRLLRRSKDVSLDVVGDGPGLARSRTLAQKLGLTKHVAFHGYVPHDQLPKYYEESTLTLVPLQVYDVDGWFDGSIQESLACGAPVAAFKSSSEAPLQGTYGFLLSKDAERASRELFELLKTPEKMDEIALKGSRFVAENCSRARVASQLQNMLESVMNN
jgi:glycosyltransferase involved in cell wall biosynthesis